MYMYIFINRYEYGYGYLCIYLSIHTEIYLHVYIYISMHDTGQHREYGVLFSILWSLSCARNCFTWLSDSCIWQGTFYITACVQALGTLILLLLLPLVPTDEKALRYTASPTEDAETEGGVERGGRAGGGWEEGVGRLCRERGGARSNYDGIFIFTNNNLLKFSWSTFKLFQRQPVAETNLALMILSLYIIYVNGNGWRYPKLGAINYFFEYMSSLYIETAAIHL